jgi:hypothetical protein
MNFGIAYNVSRDSTVSVLNRIQIVKPKIFLRFPARIFFLPEACKYDIEAIQPTIQWELGIKRLRRETEN